MFLHHDRDIFRTRLLDASLKLGFTEHQIEKDYYLFLILKSLKKNSDLPIVFKGGTSLNQAFQVINRFSEDLDLGLDFGDKKRVGNGSRKRFKKDILNTLKSLELEILNLPDLQSDRDFNRYFVSYESCLKDNGFETQIRVETMLAYNPVPSIERTILPYLERHFYNTKTFNPYDSLRIQFCTQSLERTFLDKLFAIADYTVKQDFLRNSRHLYDIYKIWHSSDLNLDKISSIFNEVLYARNRFLNYNPSAKDKKYLRDLLKSIIANQYFYNDYTVLTQSLVIDEVSFENTMSSLEEILQSKLFTSKS